MIKINQNYIKYFVFLNVRLNVSQYIWLRMIKFFLLPTYTVNIKHATFNNLMILINKDFRVYREGRPKNDRPGCMHQNSKSIVFYDTFFFAPRRNIFAILADRIYHEVFCVTLIVFNREHFFGYRSL